MLEIKTDHDICIYILRKFVAEQPERYRLIEHHFGTERGPNFVAEDRVSNTIIYAEVELDAKSSRKARSFASRALRLYRKFKKPVVIWMVASSDKWITSQDGTGVKDYLEQLDVDKNVKVAGRKSPLELGAYASDFITQIKPFRLEIETGVSKETSLTDFRS